MSVNGKTGTVVGKGVTTIKATYKFNNKVYTDSFVFVKTYDNFTTLEDSTLYVVNTSETANNLTLKMFGDGEDITADASFVSNNSNVAYVSNGKLYAKSEGSAVITAKYVFGDNTYTASFTVNVVDNTPVLSTNSDTTLYTIARTEDNPTSTSLFLLCEGVDVTNLEGVYFTSSKSSVCIVSNKTISAVGAGNAVITAHYPFGDGYYTITFNVTVIDNTPNISVNSNSSIYLLNRASQPNSLTLFLMDGDLDLTSDATFVSSDSTKVAIVNGKAVAKGVGSATITGSVVVAGKTYSKSFTVTVIDNTPILTINSDSSIYLYNRENEPNYLNLFLKEGSIDLTALTNFVSNDTSKVIIENGKAVSIAPGSTTITAYVTLDGVEYSKTFNITVIENLPNLTVNDNSSIYLYNIGEQSNSLELIAKLGHLVDLSDKATYVSSNTEYVAIENGKAIAKGVGSAKITVSVVYEGNTFDGSFTITVIDNTPVFNVNEDTTIYLNNYDTEPNSVELYANINGILDVSDSASMEASSSVVSINGSTITARKVGTTTVTVSCEFNGMTFTDSFVVTVIDNSVSVTVDGNLSNSIEIHSNAFYGKITAEIGAVSLTSGQLDVALSADRNDILSISNNIITAKAPGSAVVTVTFVVGSKQYSTKIDINIIADQPILTYNDDVDLYLYGEYQANYPLSANLFLKDNGNDVSNSSNVMFVSSNPSVAKVEGTTLTAISEGDAVITIGYFVGGVTHTVSFQVYVHGINTVSDLTLVSYYTGEIQGLIGVDVISAKYNGSAVTVTDGAITSGLTVNTNESSPSTLFVVSDAGIYSFTNVLVYDMVIFNEDSFTTFLSSTYVSSSHTHSSACQIILANDITLTKEVDATSVKQFTDTFDGRGHIIKNLNIKGSYGIFGNVKGGTIKNVAFTNVSFKETKTAVLGYSSDTSSTISNVAIDVKVTVSNGHESGALFYTITSSTTDSGTSYFTDVLVFYPTVTPTYGGTLFGYIASSAQLYSTRFTNVYVLSNTVELASYSTSKVWYAGNDSTTPSGYSSSSSFKCDGGRRYSFYGAYRANIYRYNDYSAMINAGIYKVGSWAYSDLSDEIINQSGAPVVEAPSDISVATGAEIELYILVNGARVTGATFTSSSTSVASVSGSTLTAKAQGSTTITAKITLAGTTYTKTFKVEVLQANEIVVSDETLVSIEDGAIIGFNDKIVSAYQDGKQLTVENGIITDGLLIKTVSETTTVNSQKSVNDNVVASKIYIITEAGDVYSFTNAYVYTKVITKAEEAFDIFSTYNDGEYGITTGYYALGNNIDMRELGVVRHVAENTKQVECFEDSFTVTDANGNSLVKQLGFAGYFDGRGYYLSFNATMGGLFGRLRAGSVVKNVAFRAIEMPQNNAADYYNSVICHEADAKGTNILIKDVYIEVTDLASNNLGDRTSTIMFEYNSDTYAYILNVVVDIPNPTEEGDYPKYGYGALFVLDYQRDAAAIENCYVISGERMPVLVHSESGKEYVVFAGNETDTTWEGITTVYKHTEKQVKRFDSFEDMLGSAKISSLLGSADVWNNFYDADYDLRINGVETSSLSLYTKEAGSYRDHATVYAYLNAKKISATFVSSNEDVVVYENEQFVAKGAGSATITVSYNGVQFTSINVTVKDIIPVKTQDDLSLILSNPNGIFVLKKDLVLDNFNVPNDFIFTGVLDGQGQSIKGSAVSSVLGSLNGANVKNVAVKLDSGMVINGAINSYMDNVCVVGLMDTTGITISNSVINYVEFDTLGDRAGFNRNYWDLTYGLDWKFRYTYEGTHEFNYTETSNYMVKNGASDYILLIPDNTSGRTQLLAARDEFVRLFRRATGIKISYYTESSTSSKVTSAINTGKFISLGDTKLLANSGVDVPDNLGLDGCIIRTQGNSVYIAGGSDYGALYGVYDFMSICFGFEPYYKDCVVIDTNVSELKLYNFDVTDIPDFASRAIDHGFINLSTADTTIDGITYDESSETGNAVGSDNYNTVYTDAKWFANRTRTNKSDRAIMKITQEQFYEVDDNGVIIVDSLVDSSTGALVSTELSDISYKLVNNKTLTNVTATAAHNTSEFFPYDLTYFDTYGNPKSGVTTTWQDVYLSDVIPKQQNSSSTLYRMICFTTHGDQTAYNYLVQQFANKIIQMIILYKDSNYKDSVIIMNEDGSYHCTCEHCMAAIETYGSRAGVQIKFTNDVYDVVNEWLESIKDDAVLGQFYKKDFKIYYAAYGDTSVAPTKNGIPTIYTKDNVGLYLCISRSLDYASSVYDEINDIGRNDLMKDWSKISNKCLYWLYQTNFNCYMSFYNTTESFNSEAYQMYASFGADQIYIQSQSGQKGSTTAFHTLQAYIDNKLRWDSSLDVDTLVDNYFTAMYGSDVNEEGTSAWYMKKMFTEIVDASNEFWDKYNLHATPSHHIYIEERAYWTIEKIARWLEYCDKAIENANRTVDTSYISDTVIRHVRMEKLFPLYMAIVTQRTAYSEADYYAMIAEFKDIVNQLGVEDVSEHILMADFIATLPTATFETSNTSTTCQVGTVIPVSLTMKLSDRLNSSEAVNGKAVRISSSNTSCAIVDGTNVKVVGNGVSTITVEFMAGTIVEYSYTFTVTAS